MKLFTGDNMNLIHLNGNIMCAVDVETTGLDVQQHDIVEICVLPLNANLDPIQTKFPFDMLLQPGRPQNIDPRATRTHKHKLVELMTSGIEQFKAADLFDEWFEKLDLPFGKKIVPLAHNWPFDHGFIQAWLGIEHFNHYFSPLYRDTMAAAQYFNDRATFHANEIPFNKVTLSYLASQLYVPHEHSHNALNDCLTTAAVYKKLMFHGPSLLA
jgi:DNA polymerase III epsilon subunit-like protein